MSDYTLRYVGDQALLVEFENEISIEVNQKVRALKYDLEQRTIPGMGELVPTYRALLIHYDSLRADLDQLKETIQASAASLDLSHLPRATVTEIPVLYEGEYALDLEEIARLENTTPEEIIRIHSGSDYYVYMLGFAPGHLHRPVRTSLLLQAAGVPPGAHPRRQHCGPAGPQRHYSL